MWGALRIYPPKDGNHGGIHPKATDYVEYGIPFIMANNIRGGEIHYGGCYHISLQQAQTLQKGFAKTGDVLLTHKGTVGEVAIIGRIEFPYLMLTPQVTYYRICDTSKLDTYFLATAFRSNSFQKPLKEEAGGGTRAYIGITAQKGLELSIPQNVEEQKELGNYFQKLDTLINQHQQKHDKLSNLKKAMLEKMFPKAGETVPEMRFEGFNGDWKESSLVEEAMVTTGFPFDSADFSENGDLLVITNGNIQNSSSVVDGKVGNRISSEKTTSLSQYKLNFGDILVTMDGSVGRTAKVIELNQILAQRVGRLVAKNNTEFLYQSLNTGTFLEKMTTISHGGTIKHISLSEIAGYKQLVPKDSEEQEKIGSYLKKLDDLTAQHSQQITKLKNIKQACLDKMFV